MAQAAIRADARDVVADGLNLVAGDRAGAWRGWVLHRPTGYGVTWELLAVDSRVVAQDEHVLGHPTVAASQGSRRYAQI